MTTKVALLGFCIVGKGTYRALTQNAAEIERKTGKRIEMTELFGYGRCVGQDTNGIVTDA